MQSDPNNSFEAKVSDNRLDFTIQVAEQTRRKRLMHRGLYALGTLCVFGVALAFDFGELFQDSDMQAVDTLFTFLGLPIGLVFLAMFVELLRKPRTRSFAYVWNPADERVEFHAEGQTVPVLQPLNGAFKVHLVAAPWAHVAAGSSNRDAHQAMAMAGANAGEVDFLWTTDALHPDAASMPLAATDLHDDPHTKFQMAIVLFEFMVQKVADRSNFAFQSTAGCFKVQDRDDLSTVRALLHMPFVRGVDDLSRPVV